MRRDSSPPRPPNGGLIALLVALAAATAAAQTPPQPDAPAVDAAVGASDSVAETLRRRGDLTLRDSSLDAALFTISELWNINIVAGQVEGRVNGVFKDAPLREILDSILISNDYAYRPVGESLVVSRSAELGSVNPFFKSETISVGSANAREVVEAAKLLSTPQGQVRALPSAGAVLVVDFPDRVERVRNLIRQIDAATRALGTPRGGGPAPLRLEVAYFRTHYIPAADAQAALAVVLSPEGRVSAIEGEDRLLVVDYAEHVKMVESVLARLDRPRPQVNIKALIYDITLSDLEQIGVNWNLLGNGETDGVGGITGGDGVMIDTVTTAPFTTGASGGSFTFFSLNADLNIEAVVLALQEANDSRLLADPNVTVTDNEPARIESVTEVPFQQLTQTAAGGQIGTTAFKEAGVKLDVTPKIARDGTIKMTVIPEFSRVAGFTPGDNQPIIETRRASTDIRVQSGQTAMIAGLRQRSDVGDFDGIPVLKDLRFFGHLFRARDTEITESELVVFLTPQIVGYADPLGYRDQLTSDTVGCRLERIPAAEGCPTCGPCGPGVCNTPAHGPATWGEGDAPTPVTPLPTPSEVIPPVDPSAAAGPMRQAPMVDAAPRRLPPVEGDVAPTAALGVRPSSRATPKSPELMRPTYEARYRASGGVYGGQQPDAAPIAPAAEPADEPERSWFDRVFRR